MQPVAVLRMPVVRFVREGCEVVCSEGANLRELALAEGLQLYGLKGQLGNCGGCGQCITCFVEVTAERNGSALSERTAVEDQKLRRRPSSWRLACQALVLDSVAVLTRPQVGRESLSSQIEQARLEPLPKGPVLAEEEPPLSDEL